MPLQFEDQTAAVQLGHFTTKSVLGPHVTRVLGGTGTEAVPGISSLALYRPTISSRRSPVPVRYPKKEENKAGAGAGAGAGAQVPGR